MEYSVLTFRCYLTHDMQAQGIDYIILHWIAQATRSTRKSKIHIELGFVSSLFMYVPTLVYQMAQFSIVANPFALILSQRLMMTLLVGFTSSGLPPQTYALPTDGGLESFYATALFRDDPM